MPIAQGDLNFESASTLFSIALPHLAGAYAELVGFVARDQHAASHAGVSAFFLLAAGHVKARQPQISRPGTLGRKCCHVITSVVELNQTL